ncbi:hypothetical protein O0L34_g12987 [Tuta absoluta]|nr:hypothetical protein O0L34_g12987 [Tuta absoluta]
MFQGTPKQHQNKGSISDDSANLHKGVQPWQSDHIPSTKRKRMSPSPNSKNINKVAKNDHTINIPTHNQFEVLNNTEQAEDQHNEEPIANPIPKPEPIFVTGVNDISVLRNKLQPLVEGNLFTITTLRSGHIVKIMPTNIETYKTIREKFVEDNISHYTYALKSERPYRVVLRGLHSSEETSVISNELKEHGHDVRQVVNARHRKTKEPLPLFYVDLEPKENNKEIFNIKRLNYTVVSFEAPYKKKEVLQCKRCQRFGHSKNQCYRPFRCVKCGDEHPTASCTKSPQTEATCANCSEKHPASYKGCLKYKQYKERIYKKPSISTRNTKPTYQNSARDQIQENSTMPTNMTDTYANITKNKENEFKTKNNANYKNVKDSEDIAFFGMLNIMFERFETIMKTMMDNMMDRMVQLIGKVIAASK